MHLWEEFNNAWLAIFQRQKDMLESGQRIQTPQSLISRDFITKMSKDLIRMCDTVEKHGLVDYQYGVAEERIMDSKCQPRASKHPALIVFTVLMQTLDLQEAMEGLDGGGGEGASQNPGLGRAPP